MQGIGAGEGIEGLWGTAIYVFLDEDVRNRKLRKLSGK